MEGWEPEEALINVQDMLVDLHAAEDKKAAAGAPAGQRGSGRVAKAKKQKKQVVVDESDEDSDETEGSSSKRAKTKAQMQQCMMLMANGVGEPVGDQGRHFSFEGWSGWQVARDAGSDGRLQEAEAGGYTALHAGEDDAKTNEVGDDGRTLALREEVQQAGGCSVGGRDAKDGMRVPAAGAAGFGGDSRAEGDYHRKGGQVKYDYGGMAGGQRHFGFAAGVLR